METPLFNPVELSPEVLYQGFEDEDLSNDTNPGAVIVKFYLKSELQTAHLQQTGDRTYKKIIQISKTGELGRLEVHRTIEDKVEYQDGKWVIKKYGSPRSDIKQYPKEWAAFVSGLGEVPQGTSIELMLRNDPDLVDFYKYHKIFTVEQLQALSDSQCSELGGRARQDRSRAAIFLKGEIKRREVNEKSELKDEIATLKEQVQALLSAVNVRQLENDGGSAVPTERKRGRPKKVQVGEEL